MKKIALIVVLLAILAVILAISLTACDFGGGLVEPSEPEQPEQEYGHVSFLLDSITPIQTKRYEIGALMTDMPVPTRDGYDFVGWENIIGKSYTSESIMPDLDGETLKLYAKWTVCDEMSNFEFYTTEYGITITGIKDKRVTSIIVPNYVREISKGAFSECRNLEHITIPFVGNRSNVASYNTHYPFGYIFGEDSYPGGTAVYQSYFLTADGVSKNVTYYIPSSLRSVTVTRGEIFKWAFYRCSMLTKITFLEGVTSIGTTAFAFCDSLTNIIIPDSIESMDLITLYECNNLVYNTYDNAKYLGNETNPYVVLVEAKSTSITSCKINENCKIIYAEAFSGCSSLTNIAIPDGVRSIGNKAFEECAKLTSISIPDNVTSIGAGTFKGCSNLTSISIPKGVTGIGHSAFEGCSSLISINIPAAVVSIGKGVFRGCDSLISISFEDANSWYRTTSQEDWSNKKYGTKTYVADETWNASDFTTSYVDYYWYKK